MKLLIEDYLMSRQSNNKRHKLTGTLLEFF